MPDTSLSKVVELFGRSALSKSKDWASLVRKQQCPFLAKTCYKVRKSDPMTSIGTCTVAHGVRHEPVVICPARLLERRQVFVDCLHLLSSHEPGNELHLVREVSIPGGSVDHFLVSARRGKVRDFVGVEIQTLDTTGTIWPERQRLLATLGVAQHDADETSRKPFGMNWKMTAKTILMQMHHKVRTFEHVNKRLVLVLQDHLHGYIAREFTLEHLSQPPTLGDALHLHVYRLEGQADRSLGLLLHARYSTDSQGVAKSLGL